MNNHYYICGDVCRTGRVEVPAGMTVREIIDTLGGGMAGGKSCKAVQIGGASGGLLTAEQLDLPFDFKVLSKYGIRRGDSTITVLDSDRCMVDTVYNFMVQTQSEFCGKCVPCREGTKRMSELLADLRAYRSDRNMLGFLLDLGEMIHATALCGLGKGSGMTLDAAYRCFPEEFEAHLAGHCDLCEKNAHAGFVHGGISYRSKLIRIDPEICRGCSKCSRSCHVGAISGQIRSPFHIDPDKCARCYTCIEVCPFGAIEEVELNG